MTFLHAAFALALDSEWVPTSAVARAARPKRRRHGDVSPDLQFLTMAELAAVLEAIPDDADFRAVREPLGRLAGRSYASPGGRPSGAMCGELAKDGRVDLAGVQIGALGQGRPRA